MSQTLRTLIVDDEPLARLRLRSLLQEAADLQASLAYEARVRAFHAALREYHYPKLFLDERFEPAALEALPRFDAQAGSNRFAQP